MSIAQGVVLKTFIGKPFLVTDKNKAGEKIPKVHHFYSIKLNGIDTKFISQFYNPGEILVAKEGDTVEFMYNTVTSGEYTNHVIDKKTFKVINSAPHTQIQPTQHAPQQSVQVPVVTGSYDKRDEKIVMQNSMAHATAISIHNAKLKNVAVNVVEVMSMAKYICSTVLNIDIKKWEEEIKKAQTVVPIESHTHVEGSNSLGHTHQPMQSNPLLPPGIQVSVDTPHTGTAKGGHSTCAPDFYPDDEIPNFS